LGLYHFGYIESECVLVTELVAVRERTRMWRD